MSRWALLAAWVTLVAVIAVSAWQTEQLIQANRQAIADTQLLACGTWTAIYILANEGVAPQLPPKQGQRLRLRLAQDFQAKCPNYIQEGTQ